VDLAKLARLLPAAVLVPRDLAEETPRAWAAAHDVVALAVADIGEYRFAGDRTLSQVAEARLPLAGAENARVIAFRPGDGGLEHLALVIGAPKHDESILVRLHSECFTGDLLGSLRCDCGDQLHGAIEAIHEAGAGVLLYLSQEGRGIGLVNKLRAYQLQDRGADTAEANEQLGFDADERIYLPAAGMLRQLGFARVRLLTNNPHKEAALARCGITVEERVPHAFPSNGHNDFYLATKAARFGHRF
jgi:GTP cyclohydrolase II